MNSATSTTIKPIQTTSRFPRVSDGVIAATCFFLSLVVYFLLAHRLGQGTYAQYDNFAFDFDPSRTVRHLTGETPTQDDGVFNMKHPLMSLFQPLAMPLLALGLSRTEAVCGVMALVGAATVAVVYFFLRSIRVAKPEAMSLSALFAVTATQIYVSIIPETYGFANLGLALLWLMTVARLGDPRRLSASSVINAGFLFGVTLTNVVPAFIAELLVWWRAGGIRQAIVRTSIFGILVGLAVAIPLMILYRSDIFAALADPILTLKKFFWLRGHGYRVGPEQLALTFFGYSFVSPNFSWLRIPPDINMRDFRAFSFPVIGLLAIAGWLVFWITGAVAMAATPRMRTLAIGLALGVLFNFALNMHFQFRGSVYIYAAHFHFMIFALGTGLAVRIANESAGIRRAYIASVLILTALVSANNFPQVVTHFVGDFDVPITACPAPCEDHIQ